MKKRRIVRLPERIYFGTVDYIAKSASTKGFAMYDQSNNPFVYLTTVYGLHFAAHSFIRELKSEENRLIEARKHLPVGTKAQDLTVRLKAKLGVVEVDVSKLDTSKILPFHGFVERQSRNKAKVSSDDFEKIELRLKESFAKIESSKVKWSESLDGCGTILYNAFIQPEAVTRVVIFDQNVRKKPKPATEIKPAEPGCPVMRLLATAKGPWEVFGKEFSLERDAFAEVTSWMFFDDLSVEKPWHFDREGLDLYFRHPKLDAKIRKKNDG
jgi:hypothetical protein